MIKYPYSQVLFESVPISLRTKIWQEVWVRGV